MSTEPPSLTEQQLDVSHNRGERASLWLRRTGFELVIVFVGVWAALWTDNRRERRERHDQAFQIAGAISAEITHLNEWYRPWRDSIADDYADWKSRIARGERPPPYYFRVPGSEHVPTVGWQGAVASGLLDVFDSDLVFAIGNTYHEWSEIGDRIARYHASTEVVVFPEIGAPFDDTSSTVFGLHNSRRWRNTVAARSAPNAYDGTGSLKAPLLANIILMEEILGEMDDKYDMSLRLKTKVDSAVNAIRSGR